MPLTVPFAEWSAKEAKEAVAALEGVAKDNLTFYSGDHWQNGAGWLGPNPQESGTGQEVVMAEIQRAFTSKNVIKEVSDRHGRGVVGREPGWSLVPVEPPQDGEEVDDATRNLILEAESFLKRWWDEHRVNETFHEAVGNLLLTERGPLRLYVPRGVVEEAEDGATYVRAEDLDQAAELIHLEAPHPSKATVHTDSSTGWKASVAVVGGDDDEEVVEVSFRDPEDRTQTILRVLGKEDSQDYPMTGWAGRLVVHEMRRPILVTAQAQQAQKALNLALSMLPRNVVTGGFLERVILNGMMPGEWEEDPSTGKRTFKPDPMVFGAGIVNWIQGFEFEDDETGETKITNPDVLWKDPVPVDTPISAKNEHYKDILEEVDQAHVLMNADAGASGRSREQARADYQSSLERTAQEVAAAGRWLLMTVLTMAETFSNNPGRFTDNLRVNFTPYVDAGPISPEERKQNVAEAKEGLLSKVTAMSRNGVDDPDAEMSLILAQEDAELAMLERQADAIEILTRAGMTVEMAAQVVGMDEETVALIRQDQGGGDEDGQGGNPGGFPVVDQ